MSNIVFTDACIRLGRSRQSTVVPEIRPPAIHLHRPSKTLKAADGSTQEDETKMPPKMRMRKRWTHTHWQSEVSKVHGKVNISGEHHQPTPTPGSEVGSMDVDHNDDIVRQAKVNGRVGLGIRLEVEQVPVSIHTLANGMSKILYIGLTVCRANVLGSVF